MGMGRGSIFEGGNSNIFILKIYTRHIEYIYSKDGVGLNILLPLVLKHILLPLYDKGGFRIVRS